MENILSKTNFPHLRRSNLLFESPSPIHPLVRLGNAIQSGGQSQGGRQGQFDLYCKREDLCSPLAGGGNKFRKLEYIIPAALEAGATHLVTVGGIQSNHMRQTAAACASLGLQCTLVPSDRGVSSRDEYFALGNVQMNHLLGARVWPYVPVDNDTAMSPKDSRRSFVDAVADRLDIVVAGDIEIFSSYPFPSNLEIVSQVLGSQSDLLERWMRLVLSPEERAVAAALDDVRQTGGVPYFIPSGGSMHARGGVGYARWVLELVGQEAAESIDTIVVCAASGSTLGGMVAGFTLLERLAKQGIGGAARRRLIGVLAVTTPKEEFAALVRKIAKTTMGLIDGNGDGDAEAADLVPFELWDGYSAERYGFCDERTAAAVREMATLEGILLDPVYTGKAMAGLIDVARNGGFEGSRRVLFVHTGGVPALSAYADLK